MREYNYGENQFTHYLAISPDGDRIIEWAQNGLHDALEYQKLGWRVYLKETMLKLIPPPTP